MRHGPMFHPSSGRLPDPADFSGPNDEPCAFGEPPAELLPAHHRPFVNAFWRRMVRAIENPVETDESLGIRRVQVLGQVVYEFLLDGTVDVGAWRSPPEGPTQRYPILADRLALEHVPYGDRWLHLFQEGFQFEALRRTGIPRNVVDAHAAWLFARIRRRVRHECDIPRMRRQIAAGLALDQEVVATARQHPVRSRPDGVLTVADYNAVIVERACTSSRRAT